METALWIAQALLAVVFVVTGTTKLTQPRAKMAAGPMSWAADVSDGQFRTIGVLELLGAAGLILPGVLHVAPILTPLAAAGLALTMVGAVATHLRLGEANRIGPSLLLLALALFVAIERFGPHQL
jgi:uncharacterized membrane protein YphA (DoxX/SURF4 family)